jgi:hypothetical protein
MARLAMDIGNKANTAGVMLIIGRIQALSLGISGLEGKFLCFIQHI